MCGDWELQTRGVTRYVLGSLWSCAVRVRHERKTHVGRCAGRLVWDRSFFSFSLTGPCERDSAVLLRNSLSSVNQGCWAPSLPNGSFEWWVSFFKSEAVCANCLFFTFMELVKGDSMAFVSCPERFNTCGWKFLR